MTNMCKPKNDIRVLAIDLAKSSFQLHGVDGQGEKVLGKKLTRNKLSAFIARLQPCIIVMEACGSAHYWAQLFKAYGHEARLIAPQFVKPFVKSNKNDAVDAEAIAEAALRPTMRYVAIKSTEQLENQSIHRIRSQAVKNRTALVNQIRGLLMEHGIDIPQGRKNVLKHLSLILEDAENGLSTRFRVVIADLQDELRVLDRRVEKYDLEIEQMVKNDKDAQRLMSIPGVGPLAATALLTTIGDISVFKNGRELAAFLGLVPRQHSTGGRPTLLGISKRGDVYLRTLLIHGARSVLRFSDKKEDFVSRWANQLQQRRGKNIAAVALANKIVRTAFALLSKGENYALSA